MKEDIEIIEEMIEVYRSCSVDEEGFDMRVDIAFMKKECKALENLLTRYKQLEEENKSKQKAYDDCYCEYKHYKQFDSIPKSKLKEFFSSRLEKYQEADDGKYEQDYLTRGELELVDRYKECKEIAKIILEEEINGEVPQNCIPTSLVEEKIEELNKNINLAINNSKGGLDEEFIEKGSELLAQKRVLQELLEKRK